MNILLFTAGVLVGVLATLGFNKWKTGTSSASAVKKELDDYQASVEAHFEQTAKKFKDMTDQYQDLYEHLSKGATTLCRADKVALPMPEQNVRPVNYAQAEQQPNETPAKQAKCSDQGDGTESAEQSEPKTQPSAAQKSTKPEPNANAYKAKTNSTHSANNNSDVVKNNPSKT